MGLERDELFASLLEYAVRFAEQNDDDPDIGKCWEIIEAARALPRRSSSVTTSRGDILRVRDRLLDSEEHACEAAIPGVAEDAATLLERLADEIASLEDSNQALVSERDEALGRLPAPGGT